MQRAHAAPSRNTRAAIDDGRVAARRALASGALPAIPYLPLRVTLRAEEPARLPPYRGSLLRGGFGAALRGAVCAMGPAQPCASCPLRRACVYTRLFETQPDTATSPPPPGAPSAPRPYVFEPDEGDGRGLMPGDPLGFGLVLFGQAVELQSYAVLALGRMAERGLGVRRHRFSLAGVQLAGDGGGRRSIGGDGSGWIDFPARRFAPAPLPATDRVTLRFLTPTRLKVEHHLTDRFNFAQLAARMLARAAELVAFHVPGVAVSEEETAVLLDHARGVRIVRRDLRWVDWERWSNRQRTKMHLGGFVGTLDLEGDLAPLGNLLRLAELVHVGKATTFGLGRMRIEPFVR